MATLGSGSLKIVFVKCLAARGIQGQDNQFDRPDRTAADRPGQIGVGKPSIVGRKTQLGDSIEPRRKRT